MEIKYNGRDEEEEKGDDKWGEKKKALEKL